jgi:uncharacterized protein
LIVLAGAAALLGALVQSATGFGFALVLSPALFAVLDPYEAVTTMLLLGPPLNLLVLADSRGLAQWRVLAPMLAAAVPGLLVGALALELLSKSTLQVLVGAGVIGAAGWQLRRRSVAADATPVPATAGGAAVAGVLSGVLTTSISVSGPPVVLWLEALGLRPDELRASLAGSFLFMNVAGGIVVVAAGGTGAVRPDVLLALLVLVLVGHALGRLAFRRIAGPAFSLVALGLVFCAGVASLVAGVAGA